MLTASMVKCLPAQLKPFIGAGRQFFLNGTRSPSLLHVMTAMCLRNPSACGYDRFVWFHNIGTFSHFSGAYASDILEKQTHYLLAVNTRADEYIR